MTAEPFDPDQTDGPTAGLSHVVLTDDQRHVGVPMLLHTPESLAGPEHPDRFSTAGYLAQAALGRRLLETGEGRSGTDGRLLSLNFHAVPAEHRRSAEDRIRRLLDLGDHYDPDRPVNRPQVMVAVYDGERETGLWAAALCSRLGVRAYFFPLRHTTLEHGPRLSDDDLTVVAAEHELCFHTATHRSAVEITADNRDAEVLDPLDRLTRAAGTVPRLAAWRGGARFDPGSTGDQLLAARGVRHLVSNWSVEPVPSPAP